MNDKERDHIRINSDLLLTSARKIGENMANILGLLLMKNYSFDSAIEMLFVAMTEGLQQHPDMIDVTMKDLLFMCCHPDIVVNLSLKQKNSAVSVNVRIASDGDSNLPIMGLSGVTLSLFNHLKKHGYKQKEIIEILTRAFDLGIKKSLEQAPAEEAELSFEREEESYGCL